MADLTTVINTANVYNPESFTSYHVIAIMVKIRVKRVSETVFSAHQIDLAGQQWKSDGWSPPTTVDMLQAR